MTVHYVSMLRVTWGPFGATPVAGKRSSWPSLRSASFFESVLRYRVECKLSRAWSLVVFRLQAFLFGAALGAFEAAGFSRSPDLSQEVFVTVAIEDEASVVGSVGLNRDMHHYKPSSITRPLQPNQIGRFTVDSICASGQCLGRGLKGERNSHFGQGRALG